MKAQLIASEFRIGNLLNYHGQEVRVMSIYRNSAEFGYFEDSIGFQRYTNDDFPKPIELNEEWLVNKFGWECFEDGWYGLHKFGLGYEFTWNIYDGLLRWKGSAIDCRFVHSLQNCYYAIKKQELVLKVSAE